MRTLTLGGSLAVGCGGDSDGGSALSAPPSTPVRDLDTADTNALCELYVASVPPSTRTCRYLAVALASRFTEGDLDERRARCETAETMCIESYAETEMAVRDRCGSVWFGPGCDVTAGEVEGCFRAMPGAFSQFYDQVPSCASADLSMPMAIDSIELPARCADLVADCPTLFRDAETVTPSENGTVTACASVCDAYSEACSAGCPVSCESLIATYGEACDEVANRFFTCAEAASFDCAEDNLVLSVVGCASERADLATCYALGGVTCEAAPEFDETCARRNDELPSGRRCVSDVVPEECDLFSTGYYCCPMP